MKKIIYGSEHADIDLEYDVCSHLKPILLFLEKKCRIVKKNKKLFTDKGGAHTLKIKGKIDMDLINSEFEIPEFIELSTEYHSIICRRCWCDIEGE